MARTPAIVVRAEDLERDIAAFDAMAAEPGAALQSRVMAKDKAADLRRELAAIRAEVEASKIRDPVKRLESQHQRASAAGSWVAAAQLGSKVEAARRAQEAERQRKAEERARDPEQIVKSLVAAFKRMPEAMRERAIVAILSALPVTTRTRVLAPFARGADLEARRNTA